MNALEAEDLSIIVNGKTLLDSVTVSVRQGAVTGIIGPNGAGKSTLLAALAGFTHPRRGVVRLNGVEIHTIPHLELAQQRAVMNQNPDVAFPYTIREIVEMGRTPWGTDPANSTAVEQAIELTGLSHLLDREITTLSGGERQRTAFARVIAQAFPMCTGRVLLLDEPTAAMDVAYAEHTLALTQEFAALGAAVVVVIHDLDAAASYADDLIVLDQGRVRAAGATAEVCDARLLSSVYRTSLEVFEAAGRTRISPVRPCRFLKPRDTHSVSHNIGGSSSASETHGDITES